MECIKCQSIMTDISLESKPLWICPVCLTGAINDFLSDETIFIDKDGKAIEGGYGNY